MPPENDAVDLKALATDLKAAAEQNAKATDEVKAIAETVNAELKNLGKVTDETKQKADDALLKHGDLAARMSEIEQKLSRRGGPGGEHKEQKSLGQIVVDNDEVKGLTSSRRGRASVKIDRADIMNVTGTVGSNTSGSNSLVVAQRVPDIIAGPDRMLTVRDLLMPGQTNSGSIEYVQETGFTNNARPVTEGQTKPKSDIAFELQTAAVRTIATIFKASRQILDDAPQLRSYIDGRARYGIRFAEETQLLRGDGTGQNLNGLITQADAYSAAFTPASATAIDTIRLMILQVYLAEYPATGIVLNPTDWARIQVTKDAEGRYIVGNPVNGNAATLWNLPVVQTQAMNVDEALVGAFAMGAQIFDRMEVEVLLSTENDTDFEKNMVTIRAEERLALAVYRPEAFVVADLGFVA
tara:strand:- start:3097 stop:4329 length:1233 start_codon:yes stop_codon:yes gene_type:complete